MYLLIIRDIYPGPATPQRWGKGLAARDEEMRKKPLTAALAHYAVRTKVLSKSLSVMLWAFACRLCHLLADICISFPPIVSTFTHV